MKLSVVLAVYNEEEAIGKCLASIKNIANEIIVVDGGSSDKTVDIAKSYGARVLVTNNPPIFHINKQKAVDLAKGDWILQLDADEVVPESLANEVMKVHSIYNGYYIARKNYFLWYWMRKGGQFPDYVIRLFKRGKGYFPQKSVHEQIVVDGTVGYLKTPLEHRPYKTFKQYWRKAHTYAALKAREMELAKLPITTATKFEYNVVRPIKIFLNLFVRHKGFVDGIFGFLFALFSAYQEPLAYKKYINEDFN